MNGDFREASDAAEELEAASRLAAIVESSTDAMIGKTLDGVITTWNAGAERMYGYNSADVVGQNIALLIPPDRSDELPAILRRVASGEQVDHYETQRRRKDGSVLDVSVTISPIRDRDRTIVGASTVTRDITDRKHAEADLRQMQDRLHQAQRLESVGQLAGGIAHDFNNLLAGIMNYASLAADGLAELTNRLGLGDDEAMLILTEDLGEIAKVTARAARLTHQLLTFSRGEVMTLEVLDLSAIVVEMEELLRRTIGESIQITTVLGADPPRTKNDRGRIEQVLMNLAVNARDAMPDGGAMRIETASFESDDAGHYGLAPGRYVRLCVSDTGEGMPPEVLARAFEPFFSTKATGEGTGLGLATVHGIATQAGGTVVIDSAPEGGTTVQVYLPATSDLAGTVQEAPHETDVPTRGETILLAEDEAMIREPARRILSGAGYTVLATSSAEEALGVAGAYRGEIGLLLTDVVMPGRSGRQLAAGLLRFRPATKVLYMSGYASDVMFFRGERGVHLIEKPFASENLLRRVREILDGG
ncbi:MAG: sensor hybrid histidine kinase [Actinomycetia bacterium]|jgi:PAS domain S-box-containing protein|nr:sensor hybrid histidine kinase [Actinomycetes bacterium]